MVSINKAKLSLSISSLSSLPSKSNCLLLELCVDDLHMTLNLRVLLPRAPPTVIRRTIGANEKYVYFIGGPLQARKIQHAQSILSHTIWQWISFLLVFEISLTSITVIVTKCIFINNIFVLIE